MTLLDVHSLLQLMCSDWPLTVTKNAFTPAAALCGASYEQTCKSDSAAAVTIGTYLSCLEVTFLFEDHLMTLRRGCFDQDKTCANLSRDAVDCVLHDSCVLSSIV